MNDTVSDADGDGREAEARLRKESDRIEQLLGEIANMAGPQTVQRVEELMRRTVGLYGTGLARVLHHANATRTHDEEFESRLGEDELVSSLLLLHGLHPVPTARRVEAALSELASRLGFREGAVELVGVDSEQVVCLRVRSRPASISGDTLRRALERAIHESAPEVNRIDVEGLPQADRPDGGGLVQIDLRRSKRQGRTP